MNARSTQCVSVAKRKNTLGEFVHNLILCCLIFTVLPVLALAQAPEPALDAPPANPAPSPVIEPAESAPEKNAQSPPNPVAKPNGGKLVFKPLDANPNQNVVLRKAMINRNQLAGINIGQDQAVAESMSKEKLSSVTPPTELLKLLPDLDSPLFEVRQDASQKLLDKSFSEEAIWSVLDRVSLSEEVRGRLLTAALRRIYERPRGALGIRMAQLPLERPGVVVQATLPNMPAEKFLKAGDVIEEIDGHALSTSLDLVEAIHKYQPGREIHIQLRRPEKDAQGHPVIGPDGNVIERPIELMMPLGNAEDLEKSSMNKDEMQRGGNMQIQKRMLEANEILRRFSKPTLPNELSRPGFVP